MRIEFAIYPLSLPRGCGKIQHKDATNTNVTVRRRFNRFADHPFAGDAMNPLGVHALVFAGSWARKDRERAVAGAARLGYDLIEIPLLDPKAVDAAATVKLLEEHLKAMDDRAALVRTTVAADAFVFSLDPECSAPMRPEFLTRRMRQLRKEHNLTDGSFDATILALRKWTSSELMDAGFNPAAVSGRQGHTVQVMLHHYSTRRQSADIAAAAHLGEWVHGRVTERP